MDLKVEFHNTLLTDSDLIIGERKFIGFDWYSMFLPFSSGYPLDSELSLTPTTVSVTIPNDIRKLQITWTPNANPDIDFKLLSIKIDKNIVYVQLAWWCNPFELYIGYI